MSLVFSHVVMFVMFVLNTEQKTLLPEKNKLETVLQTC